MKSYLINFSKVASALRQDGFWSTSRRVIGGLPGLLRKARSADVLFVTGGAAEGASARYRCHNQAQELALHGITCSVTSQSNPFFSSYTDKFSIYIFHRPVENIQLEKFIAKVKRRKAAILFETDDLLFEPKYLDQVDYFRKAGKAEKKFLRQGLGQRILQDPYVEACVTTTDFLARKLKEHHKRVFVSKNKLGQKEVVWAAKLLEKGKPKKNKIVIGYFSGSAGHDRDFASVALALEKLLKKYAQLEIFIAGPLELPSNLKPFKQRINKVPMASPRQHFRNLLSVDINIAPLEDNDFCRAKSELKFFEAGILAVPTVAFDNQTFREAINDGQDGYLAKKETDWVEKISRLAEDKKLRIRMGKKARNKSLENYTNAASDNEPYYRYLKSKL